MGRRPKEDMSFFENKNGVIEFLACCNECPKLCKQSHKVVSICCMTYNEMKKSLKKQKKDVDKLSSRW
jgi:hypothetical protein